MSTDEGPCRLSDLQTNGIPVEKIPGLLRVTSPLPFTRVEDVPMEMGRAERPANGYTHEQIYEPWCPLFAHIEVPLDMVFDYAANIWSMDEWTASIKQIQHMGGGLYKALDFLAPDTQIYMQIASNREAKTIDWHCAWDQPYELWMRYNWRLVDAMPAIGKYGTLVSWINYKHPYYDKGSPAPEYVRKPRDERKDRIWVGDIWLDFIRGHGIEFANMKAILETRFRR